MPDTFHHLSESARRLHAVVRTLLSRGVWLVLTAQMILILSLQWRVPEGESPILASLAISLTALALLLFFYLQAGAFHVLAQGRGALSVEEVLRGGKVVFSAFVWLTLKAGLLLMAVINVVTLFVVFAGGYDLKATTQLLTSVFGPMSGVLAFIFAYWLPWVFVRRDFSLLPSLRAGLKMAWTRLPQSTFLALVILAPLLVALFLPADGPLWLDLAASLVAGILGWVAYVYCVEVLQEASP
jgi:hypothetical protein